MVRNGKKDLELCEILFYNCYCYLALEFGLFILNKLDFTISISKTNKVCEI